MIIVTSETIVLSPDERIHLDGFLKSTTGRRMIQAVAALRPPILGGPYEAGKAAGYEEAIVNLLDLIGETPPVVEDAITNYPDLDAEEMWKDELPRIGDAPPDPDRSD